MVGVPDVIENRGFVAIWSAFGYLTPTLAAIAWFAGALDVLAVIEFRRLIDLDAATFHYSRPAFSSPATQHRGHHPHWQSMVATADRAMVLASMHRRHWQPE